MKKFWLKPDEAEKTKWIANAEYFNQEEYFLNS
jgi:hypothetical protein